MRRAVSPAPISFQLISRSRRSAHARTSDSFLEARRGRCSQRALWASHRGRGLPASCPCPPPFSDRFFHPVMLLFIKMITQKAQRRRNGANWLIPSCRMFVLPSFGVQCLTWKVPPLFHFFMLSRLDAP